MANDRIASIKGTFLLPMVSKNKKLYTKENIGNAVSRMTDRLASKTDLPLTMFPSHASADTDNAMMTLGRITKVAQEEDGSATFEADIANTAAGRDFAALVTPENPYVKGLSIRGAWMTEPKVIEYQGESVITGDDLDVFGIDCTHRPGVDGAGITGGQMYESAGQVANPIFESVDAELFFDETAEEEPDNRLSEAIESLHAAADLLAEAGNAPGNGKLPYGTGVNYADPGYQADKKKRYPLNTAQRVKSAWSYINVADNAAKYTSTQLARIKGKIKSAAGKFGIKVSEEYEAQLASVTESLVEAYASMNLNNGAGSVSTSGYTDDAGKLQAMAQSIARAAIAGLDAMDPDDDGDIDLAGGGSSSSEAEVSPDDAMESMTCNNCEGIVQQGSLYCPTCGQAVPENESETPAVPIESEAPVAEEITPPVEAAPVEAAPVEAVAPAVEPVVEAAPVAAPAPVEAPATPATVTLTAEQFDALLARGAAAPVEAAPAPVEAPPVEEAAPVAITQEDLDAAIAAAREEARIEGETATVDALRAAGVIPTRTGFVPAPTAGHLALPAEEADEPKTAEELSKMSNEEVARYSTSTFSADPAWGHVFEMADERASRSGLRRRI